MTSIKSISLAFTLVFTGLMIAALTPASAHDYKIGNIQVEHPWARATVGQVKSGGAYMEIENEGNTADRLIGVASPVAKMAHLHTMFMEDDVMKMRSVHAIDIPSGGKVVLKPGGLHVMFMGLNAPLMEGDMFPLTLTFENAGDLTIQVYVAEHGAMESMDMDD